MPRISIVIPVYNSADCLRELVRRIDGALEDYQLVLVNDGSRDASWEVMQGLGVERGELVALDLRRNAGQDNALMAGLRESTGEYVVIMDDDLQHAPEDIPALVAACTAEVDVCFAHFPRKRHKGWKNLGSWFNGRMAELLVGKPRDIYLSPFKVLRRGVVDELCRYHGPYPYIDGQLLTVTDRFAQIDVEHHARFQGRSTYSLARSIAVWSKHLTGFSVFPLRAASVLGGFFALLGFVLAAFYVVKYFASGIEVEGWTTLICVTLFMGGVVLLCLGVIGEYVGRSYLNINHKPQYSVRDARRSGGKDA